ncbi:unnamed protein product [Trichobilharzia regenti]|nr:unnamed protein product [Trichobilharzia regenti]
MNLPVFQLSLYTVVQYTNDHSIVIVMKLSRLLLKPYLFLC